MNYYIQGNPTRAEQIKAAFQELGINVLDFGFADKTVVYCSIGECVQYLPYSINLMNILYSHPDYQELELTIKPKPNFKVCDWIVRSSGSSDIPMQVYGLKKDRYLVTNMLGSKGELMINRQDEWHLWTIEDAIDGDMLSFDNETIVVFKDMYNATSFHSHCHVEDGVFSISKDDMPDWWESEGFHPVTKEQRELFFSKMKESGYQWDEKKKELKLLITNGGDFFESENCEQKTADKVEPKFKVGTWLLNKTNGITPLMVEDYDEIEGYLMKYLDTKCYFGRDIIENEYRLWEISDARNGDVLVVNGSSKQYKWIGIFKAHTSDTSFSSHCHYNCGMCEFVTHIARCTKHGTGKYSDIRPATNEERDILFAKMREAGYTWDENKKELKKLKHYDISSFHAGMPVLVRDGDDDRWNYVLFSHTYDCIDGKTYFNACGWTWDRCIPFNDKTKHLLGTTDICPEEYINW